MTWTSPTYDASREIRDHLPEAGWRAAIAEVTAREGIEPSPMAPFASGSDVVGSVGDAVVKLSAPHWRVATPAVLARGDCDAWPYVVMTRVPGGDLKRMLAARRTTSSLEPATLRELALVLYGSAE